MNPNENYPIVSIILPTYNGRSDRLSESIQSVLNQTFGDFELIIINDASTNNIEKTIKNYQEKDSRIIYVKNTKNLKLTKTLNKGISMAKGKYIARIDDDDIRYDSNKLENQIKFMENNEEYGLLGTNGIIINSDGEELYRLIKPSTDEELRKKLIIGNWFIHSSIVMRKSILDEVGGFYDEKWNFVEDYELWLRLGRISKMKNIPDIFIKYRVNSNGVSLANRWQQKLLTLKLFFKYYKFYPKKYMIFAFFFKIGELLIPDSVSKFIMNKVKNIKV